MGVFPSPPPPPQAGWHGTCREQMSCQADENQVERKLKKVAESSGRKIIPAP